MELKVLFIPLITTIVLIIALVADGKFKTKPLFQNKKIYLYFALIIGTFIINLVGAYNSNEDLNKSNSRVDSLLSLAKINVSKADASLKVAVKAFEEDRLIKEREKENVFIHLQKEVKENLSKSLINFDEDYIRLFEDTTMFTSKRFSDTYLKNYESITGNKKIISDFMELSERINSANFFAEELRAVKDLKIRKLYINNFLIQKEAAYMKLSKIFSIINNLNSYKELEKTDFSIQPTIYSRTQIKDYLLNEASITSDAISVNNFIRLTKQTEMVRKKNKEGATN